jgi:hypothetical protein
MMLVNEIALGPVMAAVGAMLPASVSALNFQVADDEPPDDRPPLPESGAPIRSTSMLFVVWATT